MLLRANILIAFLCCIACAVGHDDTKQEKLTAQNWWAIQPVKPPPLPTVKDSAWCRNEVDRFILASLEKAGLPPSAAADKRSLLRRITVDLTGLIPTPAELNDFLKDTSNTAYEKVVDRLLASPRYGERMARHWLDLVHYAESHGHDEDKHRPHAWPYRDYLIRSFNADKPYARFVQEQIAGDTLFKHDPDGVIALGMLAAGPWDQSSQMGIQDGTLDKQIARYLDRDDMLTTAMSTFTSTTVHCARCHDHKFDPITMDDYYALQAVFAGVDRTNRPYDKDPLIAQQRSKLTDELKLVEKTTANDARWLSEAAIKTASNWEQFQTKWKFLTSPAVASSGGATMETRSDHSIVSTAKRPEVDTVTVTGRTALTTVTALRLELLPDPTLPHQGPGRQDNGNLHLSEIKLSISPPVAAKEELPAHWKSATSDFDQTGWTAAMAIDGNAKTAWGIYPQVGKPHVAHFELAEPLEVPRDSTIKVTLEQLHGAGHLIGRFRLALTDAPKPGKPQLLDDALTNALSSNHSPRSDTQKQLIARHAEIERLKSELSTLPAPEKVYAVTSDFPADGNFKPPQGPRMVQVLRRGDMKQPIRVAQPGALSCIAAIPARFSVKDAGDEAQRRAALAHWLTHHDNPLFWRSIANRLWQWHFGRGLVETANDFGKMGATPTHPELLDWLAAQLRDGRSIKSMHRLLVTSAAYRQASTVSPQAQKLDVENKLFSRMPRTRLDAETTHDALLQLSGKLDLTMYGPSIKQFVEKPGLHVTPIAEYDRYNLDDPGAYRRSIYRFVFRTVPDPLMDSLDCPDGSQLTARRNASATPLLALTMLHHPFIIRMADLLAARLTRESPKLEDQIRSAFKLALLRDPTTAETQKFIDYATKHGLSNACRVLINSNEFIFLD